MSLLNLGNVNNEQDVDPGYISDGAMESLCAAILTENLNPDEIEDFVTESVDYDIVTEKNIVKLDKKAKLSRAYKVGVLQCAAEDNRKEYQKLRKLWKMEASLFRKLEKFYKNKAKARAKESVKKMNRSKSVPAAKAGARAAEAVGGKNKLIAGGIMKPKKK